MGKIKQYEFSLGPIQLKDSSYINIKSSDFKIVLLLYLKNPLALENIYGNIWG